MRATNGQTGVGDGSDSRSASPPGVWLEGRNGSVHSLGEKKKEKKVGRFLSLLNEGKRETLFCLYMHNHRSSVIHKNSTFFFL